MIKFIHKKNIGKHPKGPHIIIYYSVMDIILGGMLFGISIFFAYNYLEYSPNGLHPYNTRYQPSGFNSGSGSRINP